LILLLIGIGGQEDGYWEEGSPSKHVEWLTFSGDFNTFEEFVGQTFDSQFHS
jgi:hypothetical protein